MKYLETNSGYPGEGGFPAGRYGIIYDKSAKVVWNSDSVSPPMTIKEVKELFNSLHKNLGKF